LSQKEFGAVNKLRRNLAKQLSKSIEKDINLWGDRFSRQVSWRRSGLKNIIRDFIDEESLIAEESRASKKGLKILRKSGATKQ
jgi:hypothetical protein